MAYRLTLTRTVRLAGGGAQRWVERQERGAWVTSQEVTEPVRMGYKREGGRHFLLTPDGAWVEYQANAPLAPVTAADAEAEPEGSTTPGPTVHWRGPHVVTLVFAYPGGESEEWEVDWAHRVRTGRRWRQADGTPRWEETLEEDRRDGVRWVRRVVHTSPDPGGWHYEETREWQRE